MSVKKVSPQHGGFLMATELAPRRFVGKKRNLLNKFFCYWIITGNLLDNSCRTILKKYLMVFRVWIT